MPDKKKREEEKEEKKPAGDERGSAESHDDDTDEGIIPHSAKALADYHDGLKDLTEAARTHHDTLLGECKKHAGAMEHPEIKEKYKSFMERHSKALDDMLDEHKSLMGEMRKTFEEHHPDLEPLEAPEGEEGGEGEKKPEAEKEKPAEKPAEKKEDKDKKEKSYPRRRQPAVTPSADAASSAASDELDEAETLLVLKKINQLEKAQEAQQKALAAATGRSA